MAMLTLPATLPMDAERIRGASRIYIAPWIAAGADPAATDIHYLGQIADGGANLTLGREEQELEGEESYAPDGDVLTKETTLIKCTLMQAPIDVIALLLQNNMVFGSPANGMQSSDVNGTVVGANTELRLGYGGLSTLPLQRPTKYYQILLETPNEDTTPPIPTQWQVGPRRGYWQIFMCKLKLSGDLTYTKKNIVSLPIEIHARWDWTVVPTVAGAESVGYLWRRINVYLTA